MNIIRKALTYAWVLGFTIVMGCNSNSPVDSNSGDILVKSIIINGNDINNGQSKQLSAVVLPSNATNRVVTWSVSNTSIASISDFGLLTPLDNGTVTVTTSATDDSGVLTEKIITISGVTGPPVLVESITITGADITDGKPEQLAIQVLPENANNKVVTWSLSDSSVASINNEGLLTPKHNGDVTVTASAIDGSEIIGQLTINISGFYLTNLRADNMLLWQRSNGGWPKEPYNDFSGYDFEQTVSEITDAENTKDNTDTTIDNNHTVGEIRHLLSAYNSTENPDYLAGAIRGIDYLFEAQYDNGGWPQYYPDLSGYRHQITYNDNAMVNVMNLMWDISKSKNNTDILDPTYIDKAATAFNKGIDIILLTQITSNGKKTVWCAQHDEVTLEPGLARSYELPSFSGSESVGIVRTLMLVESPSTEIIDAIKGAIDWFNASKIVGYKLIDVVDGQPDPSNVYENGYDKILVESPGNIMWGRFYDLDTNLPFFCSRDGIKKSTIAEISHERRNGYAWYGNWPTNLIGSEYTAWKTKNGI